MRISSTSFSMNCAEKLHHSYKIGAPTRDRRGSGRKRLLFASKLRPAVIRSFRKHASDGKRSSFARPMLRPEQGSFAEGIGWGDTSADDTFVSDGKVSSQSKKRRMRFTPALSNFSAVLGWRRKLSGLSLPGSLSRR